LHVASPAPSEDEAPVDPSAIELRYRYHRARRYARVQARGYRLETCVDGWEMLRQIQDQYGAGAIPVVMFSGKADEQAQAQATSSGAHAFVGKPFDLQQLIDQTKQIAPV
jgi:CheY-like chemotaxis protein